MTTRKEWIWRSDLTVKLRSTYVEESRAMNTSEKKVRVDVAKKWAIEAWNCSETASFEVSETLFMS